MSTEEWQELRQRFSAMGKLSWARLTAQQSIELRVKKSQLMKEYCARVPPELRMASLNNLVRPVSKQSRAVFEPLARKVTAHFGNTIVSMKHGDDEASAVLPMVNMQGQKIGGTALFYPDFLLVARIGTSEIKIVVEFNGPRYHAHPDITGVQGGEFWNKWRVGGWKSGDDATTSYENDLRRTLAFQVAGYAVLVLWPVKVSANVTEEDRKLAEAMGVKLLSKVSAEQNVAIAFKWIAAQLSAAQGGVSQELVANKDAEEAEEERYPIGYEGEPDADIEDFANKLLPELHQMIEEAEVDAAVATAEERKAIEAVVEQKYGGHVSE